VYYPTKAREIALNNNQGFHLAAWAKRGGSTVYGTNTERCSARFKRTHPDGSKGFHLHAEMDLIRRFAPGSISEIKVIRFLKKGDVTMSKPCTFCQKFLRLHGIRKVRFTNWKGQWQTMYL